MDNTTTLIAGASGATGKHLVNQLLNSGQNVKIIVRSLETLPEAWKKNDRLSIIEASILDLDEETLAEHVKACDAIASCLGHNISFKGLFGAPRALVTDAVKNLCMAIKKNGGQKPVKFVLMNTTANQNRDLNEEASMAQRIVLGIIRLLLPPHSDNEKAADYLRTTIGQSNPLIEWVAVRPDGLIDEEKVSKYTVHASPTRSPIFNAGQTSRINVGHFMAELINNQKLWKEWKGQMPVLYNKADEGNKSS